ncbi:MAG: DUF3795 domain-containing protein [Thermoproteota archaeon]
MDKLIAYCGLICSNCPAFLATQKNDDTERKRVAELWSKEFGGSFKPEDINCDSCLSTGERVFNYCRTCEIRKCGQSRKVQNCAYCEEYPCEKLENFFKLAPDARKNLDELRKSMSTH